MCLAERVGTGCRPRVLEDGPDTLNSDEEAKEDIEADEEKGMYTAEMDPRLGPKMLTALEASHQRAVASALKSQGGFTTSSSPDVSSDFGNSIVSSPQSTREPTPLNSDNEDEMTEDHKRLVNHAKRCSSVPRCTSAPGTKLPPKSAPRNAAQAKEPKGDGNPASRMRVDACPSQTAPEPKAAASPRAPAVKSESKGDIGQESPGTQVPASPKATGPPRSASRAGGLRLGDGSGSMDTRVDLFHPS
jgi:hypothetical protein